MTLPALPTAERKELALQGALEQLALANGRFGRTYGRFGRAYRQFERTYERFVPPTG